MSENENTSGELNQPELTPALEPSSEPPSGQTAEAFKFGADAPPYLQGKTEQEAIDWTTNLVQEVTNLANHQSMQPQQQQVQQVQPQQSAGLPDADLMLTDPQAYQAQLVNTLTAYQQQNLAVQAQPIIAAQAETALFMSKNDRGLTDVWDNYGAEIEIQVARIPAHHRTKALYDQAARLVQGNHVEEIADKRAQQKYESMLSANPGIESANSSDGAISGTLADGSNAWDKIAQTEIGKAQLATMSKRTLLGLIEGGGETLEGYAEKVGSSAAKYNAQTGEITNLNLRSFK